MELCLKSGRKSGNAADLFEKHEEQYGASSGAPHAIIPRDYFLQPQFRRLCELEVSTLEVMMRQLVFLRRLKFILVVAGCLIGVFLFDLPVHFHMGAQLMMYGTLSATIGFGVMAVSSLIIRRVFLQEAMRLGCSKGTGFIGTTAVRRIV